MFDDDDADIKLIIDDLEDGEAVDFGDDDDIVAQIIVRKVERDGADQVIIVCDRDNAWEPQDVHLIVKAIQRGFLAMFEDGLAGHAGDGRHTIH